MAKLTLEEDNDDDGDGDDEDGDGKDCEPKLLGLRLGQTCELLHRQLPQGQ